jgi:predicted XRE-type DNA-binding protein
MKKQDKKAVNKFAGTSFLDFKRDLLKDEKEAEEYNRLKPKYDLIQQILERRIALNMSQAELARLTGLQQPAVSRLENNVNDAKIGTLLKVIEALNLSIEVKPKNTAKV